MVNELLGIKNNRVDFFKKESPGHPMKAEDVKEISLIILGNSFVLQS
jgi:hypothetical protein